MSGILVNVFSNKRHQILAPYSDLEAKSIATAPPEHKIDGFKSYFFYHTLINQVITFVFCELLFFNDHSFISNVLPTILMIMNLPSH